MGRNLERFIATWAASGAADGANKDAFLRDLCDGIDVRHPDPTTGDTAREGPSLALVGEAVTDVSGDLRS